MWTPSDCLARCCPRQQFQLLCSNFTLPRALQQHGTLFHSAWEVTTLARATMRMACHGSFLPTPTCLDNKWGGYWARRTCCQSGSDDQDTCDSSKFSWCRSGELIVNTPIEISCDSGVLLFKAIRATSFGSNAGNIEIVVPAIPPYYYMTSPLNTVNCEYRVQWLRTPGLRCRWSSNHHCSSECTCQEPLSGLHDLFGSIFCCVAHRGTISLHIL